MSNVPKLIEIDQVQLVRQTEGVGLFRFLGYPESEDEWIPWSLVEEESPAKDGEIGVLIIPTWKAAELGFHHG